MKILNVKDFGIVSDENKIITSEIQKIVDLASLNKGVVYFPKGVYVLSTIYLKSNITIKLGKGCKILGAPSFYDYAPQEKLDYPTYQDASHSYFDCSMFVGRNLSNITITGSGEIDMRSIWDEDDVRQIVHRGPKCIALKECNNVTISGIKIRNVTDLAVYFAGCKKVICEDLNLKVYIDGISPDCSKDVIIRNCYVESGDDGIVFKSSYTLNRLEICENIKVYDCKIKSRCNGIKFGTESNGGFKNIHIKNCYIFNSRITGISVETVDGAEVDNISFKNIEMKNVGAPFFVHIGKRLRGPDGSKIGSLKNVSFENIKVTGPYKVYKCMPWNYVSFKDNDTLQYPGIYSKQTKEKTGTWQITSNICGLENSHIDGITFSNIYLELDGGVKDFNRNVPEEAAIYPEVNAYGRILPASGLYFRYVDNLTLKKVKMKFNHFDARNPIVID